MIFLICFVLIYFLAFPPRQNEGKSGLLFLFFEDEGELCRSLQNKLLNDVIKKMQASAQD